MQRSLAAALMAGTLPVLSGCASGFDSPVQQDYNPTVGVNVRDGEVWALNLMVVMPETGRGTLVGALLNRTGRADALVDATLRPDAGEPPVKASMLRSSVSLSPAQLVETSQPPTVAVDSNITPGRFVTATLEFEQAAPIEAKIPVLAAEGAYADVPLP
ncbi:MAG: hypothetical protein ACRDOY_02745 [Nocardioidaceae bacterium]